MTDIRQGGAPLDITVPYGDDLSLAVTVTEDGTPYPWSGATVTTAILVDGVESETNWTPLTPSDGSLTLLLTEENIAALGYGSHRYWVQVTKSGHPKTWLAGAFTVSDQSRPPGSTSASGSLAITTAPSVDLVLEVAGGGLASGVAVLDDDGYYVGDDVEQILAELPDLFSAAAPVIAIEYNADGTIATVTENDIETSFTYNDDLTIATSTRLGTTRTYGYTAGNLVSVT